MRAMMQFRFQGLMTGLIYNRPKEPLKFLETAIAQIRANPEEELSWDMFIDKEKLEIPQIWRREHHSSDRWDVASPDHLIL
ncbi:hypothetical protein ANCCEY_08906 [Ancylostoma ceylanicum]|uniref:Uncharacterized protein n=1 Tax=Ancylostoma ceylanicum TaxID=53326 RepID=A0A0D6LJ43_9BILA|nr:hypothetical protein ANCCEY_08906 [Ancylostoma ceylanicum]